MAYVTDTTTEISPAITASYLPESISLHETDDVIFAFITQDLGSTNIATATSGWVEIGTQAASGASRHAVFYKIATSNNETIPTFTGANDDWIVHFVTARGVNLTTVVNDQTRLDWNTPAGGVITSPSLTTTNDNCLVFYALGSDGVVEMIANPNQMNPLEKALGLGQTSFVGFRNQYVAGSVPTVEVLHEVSNEGGNFRVIAINDNGDGNMGAETTSVFDVVRYYGNTNWTSPTWGALNSVTSTINGINASSNLPTRTVSASADSPWGSDTLITTSTSTTPALEGAVDTLASAIDISDAPLSFLLRVVTSTSVARYGDFGIGVILADNVGNWAAFQIVPFKTIAVRTYVITIQPSALTPYDQSTTPPDYTNITKIGYFSERAARTNSAGLYAVKYLVRQTGATIVGGNSLVPADVNILNQNIFIGWDFFNYSQLQGDGQLLRRQQIQVGDGTKPTFAKFFGSSVELSRQRSILTRRSFVYNQVGEYSSDIVVYASAADTIDFASSIIRTGTAQEFTVHASSSPSANYDFTGMSLIGFRVVNAIVPFIGTVFAQTLGITVNTNGGLDTCIITNSSASTAVFTNNPTNIKDSSFESAGTGHAIEITATGTFPFLRNSFTGYGADASTDAAIYNNSGGLVTLQLAAGDTAPTVRNGAGSSTVIEEVVAEVGVRLTNLEAGSQVVFYAGGTTTELYRTNSSTTTEEYTETSASVAIDYTVQKAGFRPIRVAGQTFTSVSEVAIEQLQDRAYTASSGLTFGSTATVNTGTKIFGLSTASTVQNYYSFMIESWIAESSLRNVAFPITPNGPNSFSFGQGWEFTNSTAIDFLSRDGMRYTNAGVVTAVYAAILSLGDATGFTGEYQQTSGGAPTNANSTGVFDQLIQVFGDATHGNFDYTGYLKLKYQPNGYRESFTDVVATYGTLADEFYIVSMEPTLIPGLATGDPMVTGVTITDHGASPVSWDAGDGAKDYSITITDSGTNTAEEILEWLNYNLSLDATFQGKDPFNWPEMVLKNGANYETIRGNTIGGTGAALKGVRVLRGSNAHPDFARFQADDGTYGTPQPTQQVVLTGGVNGSRVQLYDLTSDTELYNDVVNFPFTWSDSAPYVADREIRLRVAYQNGTNARIFIDQTIGTATSASPTINSLVTQVVDTVYNTNGIDGSAVTDVVIDDGALLVEVDTGSISWATIYAYETYWLFTEEGIRDESRFILAVDPANYRIFDFRIKNVTSPSVPLVITGGYGVDGVTGLSIDIIDTTGGTIFNAPEHVVAFATGSGVTAGDIVAIADAVWDEAISGHNTTGSTGKELTDAKKAANLSAALSA